MKTNEEKDKIQLKTQSYIYIICILLLLIGNKIFQVLGITLQSFQIGSGIILLLSGLEMIQNKSENRNIEIKETEYDPSLFPLTLPITVGPGTIGQLLVISSTKIGYNSHTVEVICGLTLQVCWIFLMLKYSTLLNKFLKEKEFNILNKLTGLFLTILATQSIINGIKTVLK